MYVRVLDKFCSFKEDRMVDKYLYELNRLSSVNKAIISINIIFIINHTFGEHFSSGIEEHRECHFHLRQMQSKCKCSIMTGSKTIAGSHSKV